MFRKAIYDFVARVAALDDLPPSVAAAIQQFTVSATIDALLTFPPQRYPLWQFHRWRVLPFGWRLTPPRTLAFTPEALIIAETDAAGAASAYAVPLADVLGLGWTINLLYGCVALQWAAAGQVRDARLEFSAVGMRLVRDVLDAWRLGIPRPPTDPAPGIDLAALPLKFRNYLRVALLPEEPVRAALFQPEIGATGGWFRSRLAPNRAVVFTDWHVIVLEEDASRTVANYSLLTRTYPWRGVRGLDVLTREDGLSEVILALGWAGATDRVRLLLEGEAARTLRAAYRARAARELGLVDERV